MFQPLSPDIIADIVRRAAAGEALAAIADALAAIVVGLLASPVERRHYRTVRWPAGEVFDGVRCE